MCFLMYRRLRINLKCKTRMKEFSIQLISFLQNDKERKKKIFKCYYLSGLISVLKLQLKSNKQKLKPV